VGGWGATQRDCTGLFESYHLRPEVAGAPFKRLPVLADFPLEHVPRAPYPNDSELYNIIRTRVRNEVCEPLFPFCEHTVPALKRVP